MKLGTPLKTKELSYVTLEWHGEIIAIRFKPNTALELRHSMELHKEINILTDNVPHISLSDARNIVSATRDTRIFAGSPEAVRDVIAMAVVVDSAFSSMLGNFFMMLQNPPYPTRLFRSEDAALEWLGQYSRK